MVNKTLDVIIIGAGASGLFCAAESARRSRNTLLLDHSDKAAEKVLISGGGKCNFTNLDIQPENYISENPHFCKSALSRFTQWDFIAALEERGISMEERDHGQLFTTNSAREIQKMLMERSRSAGAVLKTGVDINTIERLSSGRFTVHSSRGEHSAQSLVVATGGLSLPMAGAGPLGYKIAEQFGLPVTKLVPGLVPFTLQNEEKRRFSALAGIAVDAEVSTGGMSFRENLLFTHRGLSGPVILQISNYWRSGQELLINFLPGNNLDTLIENASAAGTKITVRGLLSSHLPRRLAAELIPREIADKPVKTLNAARTRSLSDHIHRSTIKPSGTEGYRTAEVTRGGVSTSAISSKTFEAREVPGLYFIGEVLDVTGWLGGYNLQWAWSSGWCAGQYV